jgi:hypothetical protein
MSALLLANAMLHSLRLHQEVEQQVIKAALPNDLVGSPLYVALKVMPGSAKALATWMADQGIEQPVAAGDLHIITVYSRTPVPLYQLFDKPKEVTQQLDPASYELGILGEEGALVMFVECSQACASHEYAASLGASWDYPSYRPHVTLSYAPGSSMPAAPPPFAIEVGAEFARRLDAEH